MTDSKTLNSGYKVEEYYYFYYKNSMQIYWEENIQPYVNSL